MKDHALPKPRAPFANQPLRAGGSGRMPAKPTYPGAGEPVWHGVTGLRRAMTLPPDLGQGSPFVRETRRRKGIEGA